MGAAGGGELAALATAAGALFHVESSLYSPLLEAHLPKANLLAAVALHHMYEQRLRPWLKTGAPPGPHRPRSPGLRAFRGLHPLLALRRRTPSARRAPGTMNHKS